MEVHRALEIINAYAAALRDNDRPLGISDALLPYDKPTIKTAIKTLLPLTANDIVTRALEEAYADLAVFVSDADARTVGRAYDELTTSGRLRTARMEDVVRIGQGILAEHAALTDELRAFMANGESPAPGAPGGH